MSGTIFAGDFFISEIISPKTVVEGTNFDINIVLVNNYNTQETIDLNITLFTPQGAVISGRRSSQRIPANSFLNFSYRVDANRSTYSNAPYLIKIVIDEHDENPANNTAEEWIVIKQTPKKLPIPDMPIYFGFAIAAIAMIFLIKKGKK